MDHRRALERGKRRRRGLSPGRRGASRWILAAAVAIVASLAFATQLAHLTVIQHAVCAEHGQVVHLAPGEQAQAPTRGGSDAACAVFEGEQQEHDHGHCAGLVEGHALIANPPPAPLTVLTWAILGSDAPVQLLPAHTDLFRLAPKTSPPA